MGSDLIGTGAVDDERPRAPQLPEDLRDHGALGGIGDAHDLQLGAARGEQGAQGIEDGGDPERLAHRLHVSHRWVVGRSEEEGEVGGLELSDGAVHVEVQRNI